MTKPLIGIPLDHEETETYSKFPWYALRENYFTAVQDAGGVAVGIPHASDDVDRFLDMIDGLLIPGGNFDVDPALFGASETHDTVTTKAGRTNFEMAITKGALARNMPVLGICGGQQLLHVILGGTLVQHIPDAFDTDIAHEQPNPRDEVGHTVSVTPGTLLHSITGPGPLSVNTAHHQAVADAPDGVVLNAHAPDGVIEGMEAPAYRFCIGVQWHPEFTICDGDAKIMRAFVDAAKEPS